MVIGTSIVSKIFIFVNLTAQNIDWGTRGLKSNTTDTPLDFSSLGPITSVTIEQPGTYFIIASGSVFNVSGGDTGSVDLGIYVNDTRVTGEYRLGAGSSLRYGFSLHTKSTLAVNDVVALKTQPIDGGAVVVRAGCILTAIRVG